MIPVSIDRMVSPRHVTFRAPAIMPDNSVVDNAVVDIYAGWFRVDFAVGDEDDPDFDDIKTFLPLDGSRNVRRYVGSEKFAFAVSAAPSGYSCTADADDDPSTTALNSASVALETQSIAMIAGTPSMLVLRAKIAAQRSTIFTFTYNVTVAGPHTDVVDVTLPAGTKPS